MSEIVKEKKQGFFVVGEFLGSKMEEKKNDKGGYVKHSVELLVDSDSGSSVIKVNVKDSSKYDKTEKRALLAMHITIRTFNGYVFYTLVE